MNKTRMYLLTETSEVMMAYVIITQRDEAIIIDGGRPADIPLLAEIVGGRKIRAWFLTHPHFDHITAFLDVVKRQDPAFDFEAVYYNFPSLEDSRKYEPEHCYTVEEFSELLPQIEHKVHRVQRGDVIQVDEVSFEILYSWLPEYGMGDSTSLFNNSSLVIRMETPNTSVLFLGDLLAEGGDWLMEFSRDKLKSEYCQMSHHGRAGVGPEVYMAIEPKVCLWNIPADGWEESGWHIAHRMYGLGMTRRWMEQLGITRHIVSKDGTAEIEL